MATFRASFASVVFAMGLAAAGQDKVIESIEFAGLENTKADFLRPLLLSQVGASFREQDVASDVQTLKNLRLFYHVESRVISTGSAVKIVFAVKEVYTLIPIAKFGVSNENYWYQIGAIEYNLLGRAIVLGGSFTHYDRNSVEGYYKNRFLFSQDWGLAIDGASLKTLEPTDPSYLGEVVDYRVDRYKTNALLTYSLSLRNYFEFGGGLLFERYQKENETDPGPVSEKFDKYLLKIGHNLDYLDYQLFELEGIANQINIEAVYVGRFEFFKIANSFKQFFYPYKNGNFGYRILAGVASDTTSPYPPFVIDSFINVRGVGDRIKRGFLETTLNLEHRHTLLRNSYVAMQVAVFVDSSMLHSAGPERTIFSFAGSGIRLHLPRFYGLSFLFDYGISLKDGNNRGFVFKLGQFF